MGPTVSVVIPTTGRPSLRNAAESALAQSYPPLEVIVVSDDASRLDLPSDARITTVLSTERVGASRARQLGIDAARGDVVALLDDDDVWFERKLETQLSYAQSFGVDRWVASARVTVSGGASRHSIWPATVIAPHQSVGDYLFRFRQFGFGGSSLPTSTLVFPRTIAASVPWNAPAGAVHDDPTWLMAVRSRFPDVPIAQCPYTLAEYRITAGSVSRSHVNRTEDYIRWGREHLGEHSARVRGDYYLTSPVSVAAADGSLRSIARCVRVGLREGRPGGYALAFALLNAVRVCLRAVRR
ncbi:glycosyltransferase family 2 protein [Actinomycetes bacterium M1A6_2h]